MQEKGPLWPNVFLCTSAIFGGYSSSFVSSVPRSFRLPDSYGVGRSVTGVVESAEASLSTVDRAKMRRMTSSIGTS